MYSKITFLVLFLCFITVGFSQETTSEKPIIHFNVAITATTNGISPIPTFTLGKPALISVFSIGGKKLSFDPEFRFASNGKPWSYVFWLRYKLIQSKKFSMGIGAHPAFAFIATPLKKDSVAQTYIVTHRFFATEITPTYHFTKNISAGIYYLNAHGLDDYAIQNTHFVSLHAGISNIKVSDNLALKFNPQVFYLKLDKKEGYYFSSSLTLSKKESPFSISGMVNKVIDTQISGKDFNWNLGLTYAIHKKYSKQ
jgi:hypothetical protein